MIPRFNPQANIGLRPFAIIADEKGNDWSGPGRNAANRPRCAASPQSGTAPAGRPTPCGWTRSAVIATTSVTRDYPPHPESLISFHSSTVKETVRRRKGDNRKQPGDAGPIGRLRPGPTDSASFPLCRMSSCGIEVKILPQSYLPSTGFR